MSNLKAGELSGHFFFLFAVTLAVFLQPGPQLYRIHLQHFANPEKASRVVLFRVKPLKGILSPFFPLLIGGLLRSYDISEGLEKNSQGKVPK